MSCSTPLARLSFCLRVSWSQTQLTSSLKSNLHAEGDEEVPGAVAHPTPRPATRSTSLRINQQQYMKQFALFSIALIFSFLLSPVGFDPVGLIFFQGAAQQVHGHFTPPPPCPLASTLGPYSAYIDPCEVPRIHRFGGARTQTQLTAHEGQGDMASFLYSDGTTKSYIYDEAGPVCLARIFFAVGRNSLIGDSKPHRGVLHVEVDGVVVLEGPIEDLFMRRQYSSHGFRVGSTSGSVVGDGVGRVTKGYPSLPAAFTFAVDRGANGTLHSGFLFQTPICALTRLRISLSLPEYGDINDPRPHPFRDAPTFVQASSACVALYDVCPLALYFNIIGMHFPLTLPPGWEAYNGGPHEPLPGSKLAAAGLPSDFSSLFSAARLLREGRTIRGDQASTTAGTGQIGPGAPPLVLLEVFSGGGTVTALTLAFRDAPALLHSRFLILKAVWDEGGGVTCMVNRPATRAARR